MEKETGSGKLKADGKSALVVGAAGGIGGAVLQRLLQDDSYAAIVAVSRSAMPTELEGSGQRLIWLQGNYHDDEIARLCGHIGEICPDLSTVVICNGVLHGEGFSPEKNLESLSGEALHEVFESNVVVPALWLRHLLAPLRRSSGCKVAVLSARVGSIGDNRLGGWYAYRSSKAALNMLLKTAAVEYRRRAPGVKLLAFHPGTTDTGLSKPFQRSVPEGKLFAPGFVADRLLKLMVEAVPDGDLSFVDWAGESVPW